MGMEQGHLQPDGEASAATRRKVQREEGSLYPGGPAPKRMRSTWVYGQGGRGRKWEARSRGRRGAGRRDRGNAKWSMPGFRVDPGGAVMVGGSYTVRAVQAQVSLRGAAGRETWLGVDLHRAGGRGKVTGWMKSSELQRRAAGNADWPGRLRGKAREGWNVEECRWSDNGSPAVSGHGLRGAVVGWYLPVMVVDEEEMKKVGGGRVRVRMKKVAVGRTAGGFEQAVGIRCRQVWHIHKMSRGQLVEVIGQRVQADGSSGVLVEGQEVWEEWTGQAVEDTEWRKEAKGQWRAREQAARRWEWAKDKERDKVYDRG